MDSALFCLWASWAKNQMITCKFGAIFICIFFLGGVHFTVYIDDGSDLLKFCTRIIFKCGCYFYLQLLGGYILQCIFTMGVTS